MSIEESIYELRKKNNLSQGDLASKLNVSRQSISKWETGQSIPDLKNIIKLSEIFNVTVDEIVKDKNINEINEEISGKVKDNSKSAKHQRNKTLGYILMAIGALTSILSVLTIPGGILLAIPIFIFGAELVLIQKNVKLIIGWTVFLFLIGVFNPWMTSVPISIIPFIKAIKSGYYNTFSMSIWIIQRVLGIILIIKTIKKLKEMD